MLGELDDLCKYNQSIKCTNILDLIHLVKMKHLYRSKICMIEVYLLKYYFESHLIYKGRYYRQTIIKQLDIMVSYVDIIG